MTQRIMKITNKFNLPDFVVDVLTTSDYTRGKSHVSVTQLIDSPRIRILQRMHDDSIEQDASEFIWSSFGTAVHNLFEDKIKDGISEERLFIDIDGWNISGAIDVQQVTEDGVIVYDYKVTSVWSVIFDKSEWHNQLNAYAWLVRKTKGLPVKEAKIVAVLRDWQRRKAAEEESYPDSPVQIVDIPIWSEQEQDDYIHGRIAAHQEATFSQMRGTSLPLCSEKEKWMKDDKFAVKKTSNKRAMRVFDSMEDAQHYFDSRGLDNAHSIEVRKGAATRCEQNWCRVQEFCDQYLNEETA